MVGVDSDVLSIMKKFQMRLGKIVIMPMAGLLIAILEMRMEMGLMQTNG